MKISITVFCFLICTILLAAKEIHAKKGCNAYGHACYGGHGKRSLGSLPSTNLGADDLNSLQTDAILQVLPNDDALLTNSDADTAPKYRLIKIMKSWFGGNQKIQPEHRHVDYTNSGEILIPDNQHFLLNGFK